MAHWSSCSINNGPALPVGDCDCGDNAPMTAEIHNIRDYQSKRAIERAHKELEKEAADGEGLGLTPEQIRACVEAEKAFPGNVYCGNPAVPYGGTGIDGMDLGPERA